MKMIDIGALLLRFLEDAPRRLGHSPDARRLNLDRFNAYVILNQILGVWADNGYFKACARQRLAFLVKNAVIQGRMDGRKVHYFPGSHRAARRLLTKTLKNLKL
jgi:hypothetical protein